MKGCTRAQGWIRAALDGELGLEERLRLDAHVARCARCRELWAAENALEEALLRLPEPPVERIDLDQAVRAVRARLDEAAASSQEEPLHAAAVPPYPPARSLRRSRVAASVLVAAAGVAAAIWLRSRFDQGEEASTAAAAVADAELAPRAAEEAAPQVGELAVHSEALPEELPEALHSDDLDENEKVDLERLDEVRKLLALELAAAWGDTALFAPRAEILAAADAFDARTADLARSWPRLRIVQGLASGEPRRDRSAAGAAIRYLGVRGDAIAAGALRDALDDPELALAAVLALGDLGEQGLDALGAALARPELVDSAVERIVAIGGAGAARVLAEAAERGARAPAAGDAAAGAMNAALGAGSTPSIDRLLNGLARLDPPAVAPLLRLAQREPRLEGRVLDLLAATSGAADALGALFTAGSATGGSVDVEPALLLHALARLRPPQALAWLAERATERGVREDALACLAAYADAGALAVLADLHASGRARPDLVLAASRSLLATAPEAGVDLARRSENDKDEAAASALLSLALATESPDAVPALAALAFASVLHEDERQWAALAVGELGRAGEAGDAARLIEGMRGLGPGNGRLAAACLLSADALGRADAALEALGALEPRSERRLAALLAEARTEGTRAVILYKVARELEPYYDTKHRNEANQIP